MNILILHNLYQKPGGEDVVVRNEAEMLERAGHQVTVERVDNHAIQGFFAKARTALRAAYDPARRRWMRGLLERVKPDVVHVHNFFPLLTTAVHAEARACGVPLIQTLHNFRLFCAAATFERDGQICELCVQKGRINAVVHRCYRGSIVSSAAVAAMQYEAVGRRSLIDNVDRFIALTQFARSKFLECGLPPDKVVVKPNHLNRSAMPQDLPRHGALFVGRISKEKGLVSLVEAWRQFPDIPLTIVGDGPLREDLQAVAPANVRFLGWLEPGEVDEAMQRAALLIVPSLWYEGFGMVLIEAFANGLPVAVSRLGSLAEIVEPGITGDHFTPGDERSIVETVRRILAAPAALRQMSANARRVFQEKYSAESNLAMLEAIYAEAIEDARGHLPAPSVAPAEP